MRTWVTGAVALAVVAGCGGTSSAGGPPVPPTPPVFVTGTMSPEEVAQENLRRVAGRPAPTPTPVRFEPCGRGPARSTNLRPPGEVPGDAVGLPRGRWVSSLHHVARLRLPDGKLDAGNGFEVLMGGGSFVDIAPGTVTADVTMAVVEGGGDRRVAFVELRVGPERPTSWAAENDLGILTDGGDGGFVSSAARAPYPDGDPLIQQYVDALYVDGEPACTLRLSGDATEPDGLMFATGIGDGGYATYVGRDAAGRVVSVVHHGGQLPWSRSGLPGTPPRYLAPGD